MKASGVAFHSESTLLKVTAILSSLAVKNPVGL